MTTLDPRALKLDAVDRDMIERGDRIGADLQRALLRFYDDHSAALSQPQAGEPMEPLGADFEAVWDKNVAGLYESDPASPHPANPAQVTDAAMPSYGTVDFLELGKDVNEASTGKRSDFDFGDGYPGHAMLPALNFNSLSRIVSKYLTAAIGAGGQAVTGIGAGGRESPLEWAVEKWHHEVANRPLKNVHRAALDTTWRQVIRHFGGNPDALCGPDHYAMIEQNPEGSALSQPHPADERVVEALEVERREHQQCANRLLASEAQANRDYQALLEAHYHDERDLAVVIEVLAISRQAAQEGQ